VTTKGVVSPIFGQLDLISSRAWAHVVGTPGAAPTLGHPPWLLNLSSRHQLDFCFALVFSIFEQPPFSVCETPTSCV
jgi:hypothetical protein